MRTCRERPNGVPDASERVAGEDHWATVVNGARTQTRSASSEIESAETSNESSWLSKGSVFDFHAYRSARTVASAILSWRAKSGGTTSESSVCIIDSDTALTTVAASCNGHERNSPQYVYPSSCIALRSHQYYTKARLLSPTRQPYRPHLSRVPRLPVSTPPDSFLRLHVVTDRPLYGTLIRELRSGGVRVM